MAKKSVSKTDWKFVVLVFSLIILGISVWAVNNKLNTTNTQAADICRDGYSECVQNCRNGGIKDVQNCIKACQAGVQQCRRRLNLTR